jgi:hypothetical protein
MKYMVRLRKTITLETEMEVSDDMVDNVVDAMDIAEGALNEGPPVTEGYMETESKWAVTSVRTKE